MFVPSVFRRYGTGGVLQSTHNTLLESKGAAGTITTDHCKASTLYTLQGSTAAPGLIHYFRTPRRLSNVMKWISCYMALSRVRSLSDLRSIGLTSEVRELIDLGPPDGFLTRFLKVFQDKITSTQLDVEDALVELGWNQ